MIESLERATVDDFRIHLHGFGLDIVCDVAPVLVALQNRLAQFPRADARVAARATIVYNPDRPPHSAPANVRPVYRSATTTAVYSDTESALYAFHTEGPTLRCEAAAGTAEIASGPSPEDRLWVLTRPLLTLALMELTRPLGLHPLHAACLSLNADGVLICGASGVGKSTLALALALEGLTFLSDDLAFVTNTGTGVLVRGFPDELGISRGTAAVLAAANLPQLDPPPGWPKARAHLDALVPHAAIGSEASPRLILILSERSRAAAPRRIGPDLALLELLPTMLLTDAEMCGEHLATLSALVATTPCFMLPARPSLELAKGLCSDVLHRFDEAKRGNR